MTIAFEGVSVVPMDNERVVDGQTVIVDGDRITWIGPDAEARIPPGAQRVNGRGKYLMPGLADMHSHPCDEDDLLLLVAHGVTTVRNLEGMPRHVLWRERVAAGQLLGPTIHTSGPMLDGRPVRNLGSLSVVTRQEALAGIEETRRGGYECVKVYDQLSMDAYDWVVEAAREHGLPVDGHVPFQVGLPRVLDAGQRSIEHLYGYPQALQPASRPAAAPKYLGQVRAGLFDLAAHAELDRIPEFAEATRAAGTWNCPTLIVRTRWLTGPAVLSALPELRYLSPLHAAQARYFFNNYPTEPERFAVPKFNAALLRGLHEAGAGLLVGTDAGVPGIVYGASVHEELRAFVDAGLSPFDALRAATSEPARFFGEAGQWGQITVGARADLMLLEGNPLANVSNTSSRTGVMVRGRWLPQLEIDDLLADLAVRRHDPLAYSPRSARPPSVRSGGEVMHFAVTWGGFAVGEEHVAYESAPSGSHQITATANIGSLGTTLGSETGIYRASVTVDEAGIDQAAWFEFDGDDGLDRVEVTRVNGTVHIKHSQATTADLHVTVDDPDASMLFGRPLVPLFARLAERLTELEVGAETDVPVVAPGISPDLSVGNATLHATRLPNADTGEAGARYLVEFRRPNWFTAALLTCDRANRPLYLELGSDLTYWHSDSNTASSHSDDDPVLRISRVASDAP